MPRREFGTSEDTSRMAKRTKGATTCERGGTESTFTDGDGSRSGYLPTLIAETCCKGMCAACCNAVVRGWLIGEIDICAPFSRQPRPPFVLWVAIHSFAVVLAFDPFIRSFT